MEAYYVDIETDISDEYRNSMFENTDKKCDFWRNASHFTSLAAEVAIRRSLCSTGEESVYYARLSARFGPVEDDLFKLRDGLDSASPSQRTRFLNALSAAYDLIEARNRLTERRIKKLIEDLGPRNVKLAN